jgi:hypothetical protein
VVGEEFTSHPSQKTRRMGHPSFLVWWRVRGWDARGVSGLFMYELPAKWETFDPAPNEIQFRLGWVRQWRSG